MLQGILHAPLPSADGLVASPPMPAAQAAAVGIAAPDVEPAAAAMLVDATEPVSVVEEGDWDMDETVEDAAGEKVAEAVNVELAGNDEPYTGFVGPSPLPWAHILEEDAFRTQCGYMRSADLKGIGLYVTLADVFRQLFPHTTLQRILRVSKVSEVEFWKFVACLQLMATYPGRRREEFWEKDRLLWDPLPPLHRIMSFRRFRNITENLCLSDAPPIIPKDEVQPIREMQHEFNEHMHNIFEPGTRVCLDESMNTFDNETCPAFVHVERKPHPNGNEYHTIADVETKIIYRMEIVEGKSRPAELPVPKHQADFGKMGGLVLRMTESIWHSGRIVAMDSAFCLLETVAKLREQGLFCVTVAKKHGKYWPRHFKGDHVQEFMQGKPIGKIFGYEMEVKEQPLRVFSVNHNTYAFLAVATYGVTAPSGPARRVRTATGLVTYARSNVLRDYYEARHVVDDNNRLRQGQMAGLDDAWPCKSWHKRQLLFLIALVEVNSFLAHRHFVLTRKHAPLLTFAEFRRNCAHSLIQLSSIEDDAAATDHTRRSGRVQAEHQLISIPRKRGKWDGADWSEVNQPWQQQRCSGIACSKRTRRVCSCNKAKAWCLPCHALHVEHSHVRK